MAVYASSQTSSTDLSTSANTETSTTFQCPSGISELLFYKISILTKNDDPAVNGTAVCRIFGVDFNQQPQESIVPFSSTKIGAVGSSGVSYDPKWIPIFAPMTPNGTISLGVKSVDAIANGATAMWSFIWSTTRSGKPTIYRKVSDLTGTTSTTTAATTITAASMITGISAIVSPGGAVSADDPLQMNLALTSPSLELQTTDIICQVTCNEGTTSGIIHNPLSHYQCQIPVMSGRNNSITFNGIATYDSNLTNEGQLLYQVDFNGFI